jgi:hypothetical protein
MSVGGPGASEFVEEALADIYRRGDVLLLAAAGNDGNATVSFPAGYTQVVSVAATAPGNNKASFSQYNADVELAAPGVSTLSTLSSLDERSVSSLGGGVVVSPPVNGDPDDSSLRAPPLTEIRGSAAGTRTGGLVAGRALASGGCSRRCAAAPLRRCAAVQLRCCGWREDDGAGRAPPAGALVDCGLAFSPCANAAGKVCLIQRGGSYFCQKVGAAAAADGSAAVLPPCVQQGACCRASQAPSQDADVQPQPSAAAEARLALCRCCPGPQLHGGRRRGGAHLRPRRPAGVRTGVQRDPAGGLRRP